MHAEHRRPRRLVALGEARGRLMPATLITASSPPNSSTSPVKSASIAAASVTDVFEARAAPPAATMRSAVVSVGAWSCARPSTVTPGSTVTTYAPVRPTASAMAAPMPAPPPVTTTTCCRSAALLSAATISPFDVATTPSLKARLRSPARSAGRRSRPAPASRGATSGTRRSRPSRPGRYRRVDSPGSHHLRSSTGTACTRP